ncbi:protein TRANSPARENT TESTA 9 isoform X2 [Magnolia sinica]|uniref:protein TRANSPARENT TESTA 9 isoform X2 n=1 Tax=Magnolia sinica TaxID=86752 RepID=UPI0026597A3D|nr:protein TRANSPARENT TESTA 9 isoform X2 [Magnolia sinica]
MRFAFWRSRNRFSLEELRYLTDQLQRVPIVNDLNKDYVIEALRSIAEIITYGDQHDPTFFEFFMENQVMGEFVRILKVSKTASVSLQLLQTMSIMIQNLKSEHAICKSLTTGVETSLSIQSSYFGSNIMVCSWTCCADYIFSNEHINHLIAYSFDFGIDELLSYYISFLRAISGKLNKNTISLLVKTQNDEVVSFPLYVKAIRFAFHEENMVRIAVRALTLNVYHVGDEYVNRYVTSPPLSDYFANSVTNFRKQCISLDEWVAEAAKNPGSSDSTSSILSAVDEIEDTLYYFSDVISSGVPNLGRLITDNILQLLVFPLLLPSLKRESSYGMQIGAATSLYLISCILRVVKTKELASSIGAALFCPPEAFIPKLESKTNGCVSDHGLPHESQQVDLDALGVADTGTSSVTIPDLSCSSQNHPVEDTCSQHNYNGAHLSLRDVLLSYIISGDDIQASGALSLLATLLQTKELDESMLDALGILPQRKQHKKLLLQALVGEGSGEEQLFSSASSLTKDDISSELDIYLQNLKVLDALASLLCRSGISAETLWDGGWLLRQLLPHSEEEFNSHHFKLLRDSYSNCTNGLIGEIKGSWCDLLIAVMMDEWKKCKRAIEASSPQKDPKSILLPPHTCSLDGDSSSAGGERMYETVKVFVLHHQLRIFCGGGTLPDQSPVSSPLEPPVNYRAKNAGLDVLVPKPNIELKLVDAVPCRIAFERGKERHLCFLAISRGTSGWVVLAEELPLKQNFGVVRVAAPLAGSNPRIDDKHPKWLHLRIRPSTLPLLEPTKLGTIGIAKAKALIDGRWTLAFRDELSCKSAESMILEEMNLQSSEVEKRLRPWLDLDKPVHSIHSSCPGSEVEKRLKPLFDLDRPVHARAPSGFVTEASSGTTHSS